jgi:hypothetical protein
LAGADLTSAANFPNILKAQMTLMVQAMLCGRTKVGVIQAGHHTMDLDMTGFPSLNGAKSAYPTVPSSPDMASHTASHYGAGSINYTTYIAQVTWWVSAFSYLLDLLQSTPEGTGSMLDNSLVLMCSEIADGNNHYHDNLPFILAGGGCGAINPSVLGTLFDGAAIQASSPGTWGPGGQQPHSNLLTSLAIAMGDPNITMAAGSFGQNGSVGGLAGLLS